MTCTFGMAQGPGVGLASASCCTIHTDPLRIYTTRLGRGCAALLRSSQGLDFQSTYLDQIHTVHISCLLFACESFLTGNESSKTVARAPSAAGNIRHVHGSSAKRTESGCIIAIPHNTGFPHQKLQPGSALHRQRSSVVRQSPSRQLIVYVATQDSASLSAKLSQ
jgi:hypothetical protein